MSNSKKYLCHFIKKEYLENFLAGKISLAHFSYYQNAEVDPSGRNDINEGIISMHSSDNIRLFISREDSPGEISPLNKFKEVTDLKGIQKTFAHKDTPCHIFSASAISVENKGLIVPRELKIDRDFLLLIKSPKRFFQKFHECLLNLNLAAKHGLVEYIDINPLKTKETFFVKYIQYSNQTEYRIAVFDYPDKERLLLNLGDLRDLIDVYPL